MLISDFLVAKLELSILVSTSVNGGLVDVEGSLLKREEGVSLNTEEVAVISEEVSIVESVAESADVDFTTGSVKGEIGLALVIVVKLGVIIADAKLNLVVAEDLCFVPIPVP